jgi:hypothetical protein
LLRIQEQVDRGVEIVREGASLGGGHTAQLVGLGGTVVGVELDFIVVAVG